MIIAPLDLLAVGLLLTVWLAVEMWEAKRWITAPKEEVEDIDALLHICVVCEHAQEDHYNKRGRCTRDDVGCHCGRFRGR